MSGSSDPDVISTEDIIKALYECVCYEPGKTSDWVRLRKIFLPEGQIIPPEFPGMSSQVLSIDEYISLFDKNVDQSGMREKGFFEQEISSQTDIYGNIAQVFSSYESKFTPGDEVPFSRGINSIQLMRRDRRWWVVSIIWDYEREDNPMPEDFKRSRK